MENQKIINEIESVAITTEPSIINKLDDGREEHIYYKEKITVDNIEYTYSIDWVGFNNNEDGGIFGTPYDIQKEDL